MSAKILGSEKSLSIVAARYSDLDRGTQRPGLQTEKSFSTRRRNESNFPINLTTWADRNDTQIFVINLEQDSVISHACSTPTASD